MTTEVAETVLKACEPTALYRFYDSLGSLLYIGITSNITSRLVQHERAQPWWRLVARVEVEHHSNRAAALSAEQAAIYAESPRFNKVHARPPKSDPNKPKTPTVSVRLDPELLWQPAVALAASRGETASDVIRLGLEAYLADPDAWSAALATIRGASR